MLAEDTSTPHYVVIQASTTSPDIETRRPSLLAKHPSWLHTSRFRTEGLEFRFAGVGFRVQGLGFQGLGCKEFEGGAHAHPKQLPLSQDAS